ncbi:3',5'-cyclic-nucleotide phosphodiesterase [Pedobacter sp. MC2016-15]|uniref:MBL fold metallo-hydrolase n=1 Tax=Pedobacter sp. MC2016-15 TaxID=2994473 RepID=UPI0022455FC7|nr:3',5'-cyclic-nucleotide phosphodiesterase [Pedobacter sp. MC2016-15]MCX2480185.1 3',5'-cyclic-nucleotide phosphodiesterase [Pedobacter sp. MC2016-15]
MIKNSIFFLLCYFIFSCSGVQAQSQKKHSFKVLPLGIKGGLDEGNLSAYMIAPVGTDNYICADAGTVRHGIDVAIAARSLKGTPEEILKDQIKGYMISHAHLDHVAGLIMNSPEDAKKNIYALPSVAEVLKDKYFTWKAWANFTNEGDAPHLDKYTYQYLKPAQKMELAGTEMVVTAFPLSHGPAYESTAFLIQHGGDYLLYLGDTGADQIENSTHLQQLWTAIAPLVRKQQLKAIFIETSFFDKQPDKLLFGHLTPRLLMQEMGKLSELAGLNALKAVPLVITHMKSFGLEEKALVSELKKDNQSGFKLVFPVQGKFMLF